MIPLPKGAGWQIFLLVSLFLLIEEANSEARIVCYYTNWSVYRPGTAKFNPQNINPYLCTHLIYAFGGFTKDNTLKPFDKYQDIEQGGYSKFTGLKTYNKNLKTLLAIGGWNEGSSRFSPLVANPERRQQFIKNTLKFLRQNHFDGLDLDWEYPAYRDGGKPRDKENYAQFVQELRSEFDRESSKTGRPRLLLTMAVPAGIEYIGKGYDIPKLNKYLDWFNILSYDYHSAYEPSVNHHSPLLSLEEDSEYNYDAELNIDYSVKFYLNAGADRDKIVLGIPTYGRTYTLVDDDITDLGSPADGPGDQGDATREKGYLAYYEICQNLREDPDWTVVQPNPKAMGPYAFKGNQWVGYDDEAIVRRKAEYVAENGLGGIMFWSIDNDDFRGVCGGKQYPLIEAAKEALLDSLGFGANEVSQPVKPKKPSRSRSRQGSAANRNNIINDSNSEKAISTKKETTRRTSNRRRTSTRATSAPTTSTTPTSLYIGGRTTTPEPPTTPDPGSDFKCEEEGFFAHPRDCKKYFWCLDSGPSNLGIVAHQFTCPSGLFFNTAADSCDFSRNVLCKTKTTTAKPAKAATTTTTTSTTTPSPRITAATSRNSFFRVSSTTEAPDDEEYDDEEEEADDVKDEEDPRVIKELIDLIKKVGGLEELEKQLLQQDDGSMVLKNSKTGQISTTPSPISKSLYSKVLSRPNSLNTLKNRFGPGKLSGSTTKTVTDFAETEQETNVEKKSYSSVIRNSRPGPQNDGIDKLPEFEGFLREKPKYVTIQRTRPTLSVQSDEDADDEEDEAVTEEEVKTVTSANRRVSVDRTTASPSYINIRRTRPTTATAESEEPVVEVSTAESSRGTGKVSYQSLNRGRQSTTSRNDEEDSSSTLSTASYRYKTIERTRYSTAAPDLDPNSSTLSTSDDFQNDPKKDEQLPLTVQFSDLNQYTTTTTTQSPTQDLDATTSRIYSNIARKTTFGSRASTTILTETTPEPTTTSTTIRATTTTTNTPTTSYSITNTPSYNKQNPQNDDLPSTQNIIQLETEQPQKPNTVTSTGLDVDGIETTSQTDNNNTDDTTTLQINKHKDEVTLTDNTVEVDSSSILPKLNLTNFNTKTESSLNKTESSLSNVDNTVTVTSTATKLTDSTETTTAPTTVETTTKFLGTVSSPRPFSLPNRRTRPTSSARKPTTNPDSNNNNNTSSSSTDTTTTSARKTRPTSRLPITRRPVLSVRRRLTTASSNLPTESSSSSSSVSFAATVESSTLATLSATGNTKYTRRTRPTYLTSTTFKPTEIKTTYKTTAQTTTNNELAKPTQKLVIRRKFGRPNSNAIRRSTTTQPSPDEIVSTTIDPPIRTANPLFRRKYTFTTTLAPATTTTTTSDIIFTTDLPIGLTDIPDDVDQEAGSSSILVHDSKFTNNRYNQIGENLEDELVDAIKAISNAPIPGISSTTSQYVKTTKNPKKNLIEEDSTEQPITRRIGVISTTSTTRKSIARRPQKTTTTAVPIAKTTVVSRRRPKKPEIFDKIDTRQYSGRTYRPILDYDYYDDDDVRIVGKTSSQVKVILHGPGIIECLDQGNFPHPLSCRKFISCAKMETGGVVGWEYTCPKGLSYDPVGGICNWAAGLGCKE